MFRYLQNARWPTTNTLKMWVAEGHRRPRHGQPWRRWIDDILMWCNKDIKGTVVIAHIETAKNVAAALHHPTPLLGGGVRDNVRCLSWAYWKAHSGLSISVNWTFFARCYGWGAIRAKINRKIGDFAATRQFDPKFQVEGGRLHQSFLHGLLGQWMPVADGFHKKKLCSRLTSSEVRFFLPKWAILRFEPPLGNLYRGCVRWSS